MQLFSADAKIFFQPAKFDNFKDEKISDFFYVLGVKKEYEIFLKNIVASALKSCIK